MYFDKSAITTTEILALLDLGKFMDAGINFRILEMMIGKGYEYSIQQSLQVLLKKGIITQKERTVNQWRDGKIFYLSQ